MVVLFVVVVLQMPGPTLVLTGARIHDAVSVHVCRHVCAARVLYLTLLLSHFDANRQFIRRICGRNRLQRWPRLPRGPRNMWRT